MLIKKKQIAFITGTRADFGKIKTLINKVLNSEEFSLNLFVTGMHLEQKYGYTITEIENSGFKDFIFPFINTSTSGDMEMKLAKTVEGFSTFVRNRKIDLIVVHGDRPETLAGAIVGSFNNILVAHIEGGEVSGTIDEMIRHSTSKLSHFHFVSNNQARNRLIRFGEDPKNIVCIGSPDIDILMHGNLPSLDKVKSRYEIIFSEYSIVLFHPVTTDFYFDKKIRIFIDSLLKIKENFIVIYPNDDKGNEKIIYEYEKNFRDRSNFKIFPSLRFEYYLTLLKNSKFIIGNSSSGIHEAPYFKKPTINIGTRQNLRSKQESIINVDFSEKELLASYFKAINNNFHYDVEYGDGSSSEIFLKTILKKSFWKIDLQKYLFGDGEN